jgi:hypothetical protein
MWASKAAAVVDIADIAPRYVAEGRTSFLHMLSGPMRSLIDGIATKLGGRIAWCSRTHLTKKTDEFLSEQLEKSNRVLQAEIVSVPNAKFSVTFDAGQAKNGHSFLALTMHWMTASPGAASADRLKLQLKSTVGGCHRFSGKHRAEHVESKVSVFSCNCSAISMVPTV